MNKNFNVVYIDEITQFLNTRRAHTHAGFFTPNLKPGMSVLDCGCGPGSITIDIAELVAPGKVTGIDINQHHLEVAKHNADKRNITNVSFEYNDITALNFESNTFDAVFVNGVIEYVNSPAAFLEIFRVLKVGGFLGSRQADWGGFLIAPNKPELTKCISLFANFIDLGGGDKFCGRNQLHHMKKVGFDNVKVSASYDHWSKDRESTIQVANMFSQYYDNQDYANALIDSELTSRQEISSIQQALAKWSGDESAFAAEAYCEAVGWKLNDDNSLPLNTQQNTEEVCKR